LVPWKRDASTIEWVSTRSSLPLEQRVLRDHSQSQPQSSVPRFTAFVRATKARLLQDLKNLPMRDGQTTVERQNVSVYPDDTTQQVLVVYSPNDSQQLEFISFALLDPANK
jgi:predicted YcjX-like family ATPase